MSDKKAVVLGGGGSRGAYQVGVWRFLNEIGYDYKIVTGSSVGALNGAVMAMGDVELGERMWSVLSTQMVLDYTPHGDISTPEKQREAAIELIEKAIREKSIDQTPLKNLLTEIIDVDKVCESGVELGVVATKYPSLRGVEVYADEIDKSELIDYLMASSACFPTMRAYRIDGEQYIDGGFYEVLPINMALRRGATEIVAVNLKSPGVHARTAETDAKITVIEPKNDLGFLLLFEPDLAKVNIKRGYLDAKKALGHAEGWAYTFMKDTFAPHDRKLRSLIKRLFGAVRGSGAPEKLFADAQYKVLELRMVQKTSSDTVKAGIAMPAAEIAAEIFGVSPLEEYSKQSFDEALLGKLAEVTAPDLLTNPDLTAAFKAVTDDRYIAKYLVAELKHCMKTRTTSRIAPAASGIRPNALIAAIYCIYAEISAGH